MNPFQYRFMAAFILLLTIPVLDFLGDYGFAGLGDNEKMIAVKVLSIKGCQATPPTIELVESVAREMNLTIDLKTIEIGTQEQAKKYRFIGSPTVQIDGYDIEPASRKIELFGLT